MQSRGVINMRSRTTRKVGDDRGKTFKLVPRGTHLRKPECPKGNDENSHPFRTVQSPTRKKSIRRNVGGAAADAERLPGGFLTYLPNESVVIKMEQRRSGHHTGENAFDCFDADTRLEIAECPVSEDQPHIKADQRATTPEHEAHKPADRAVGLNPFAIIDPDQREVLDVVKYFE